MAASGPGAAVETSDRGQATLEMALVLPIVLVCVLAIVQVGVVVRDAIALDVAAQRGARAYALYGDDAARVAISTSAGPLRPDSIGVALSIEQRNNLTLRRVELTYSQIIKMPLVGAAVPRTMVLRSMSAMRQEGEIHATPAP